jgi:hypothetical protein
VASPEELAAFDAAPSDSVGAFVGAFWAKRDAEELRAPGERLAEHVRRWRYIFEHFQLSARAEGTPQRGGANCGTSDFPSLSEDPLRDKSDPLAITQMAPPDLQLFDPGVFAATWRGKRLVDDRALVYMRHGEPDERAGYHGSRAKPWDEREVFPNESWKYVTVHGTLLFHFCGSMALGTQAATTLVEMLPLASSVLESRGALDPRFDLLARSLRSTAGRNLLQALILDGKRDIAVGLSTDEFSPKFKHQIDLHTQFFAVGQPGPGSGKVLAVFAFAGDQLTPTPLAQGGVVYPLALRLIATDAAGHIHRIDTTRYFRSADTLRQGQFLFGTEELPVGAGTWDVRLLVTQPGVDAGGAIERREVTLATGGTLGLSDLVFGREGSGLSWQSAAGAVPLNPLDAYPRSGSVEVYYELSGTAPGHAYVTELDLKGVAGDARGEVRLGFTETARSTTLRLRRSVALDQLKGGQYRMTVTVTEDGTGKSVTRSRLLNVIR